MYKRKIRDYVVDAVLYILLGIFAFLCLYPFYYIFIYSISNPELAAKTTITFLPAGFSLATYARLLSKANIFHAAFISVARTVLGTDIWSRRTSSASDGFSTARSSSRCT